MTVFGKIKDGRIELPPGIQLPEGQSVRIDVVVDASDPADDISTLAVESGVNDLASQHDHSASGAPRRKEEE